jgi:FHS family L-fucose permease-like MFS transporter
MAIVGGALVPVLGGVIADRTSLAAALILPAACYAVIASFGWFARRAAAPPVSAPVAI